MKPGKCILPRTTDQQGVDSQFAVSLNVIRGEIPPISRRKIILGRFQTYSPFPSVAFCSNLFVLIVGHATNPGPCAIAESHNVLWGVR